MNPYPSQNPIRTTARKVTTATNQTKPAQVHRVVGPVAEDVGVDGVEDHRLVRMLNPAETDSSVQISSALLS